MAGTDVAEDLLWKWHNGGLNYWDACCKCKELLKRHSGSVVVFQGKNWCVPCLLTAGTAALTPVKQAGLFHEPIDDDFSNWTAGTP